MFSFEHQSNCGCSIYSPEKRWKFCLHQKIFSTVGRTRTAGAWHAKNVETESNFLGGCYVTKQMAGVVTVGSLDSCVYIPACHSNDGSARLETWRWVKFLLNPIWKIPGVDSLDTLQNAKSADHSAWWITIVLYLLPLVEDSFQTF